jgi:hypothetical protein
MILIPHFSDTCFQEIMTEKGNLNLNTRIPCLKIFLTMIIVLTPSIGSRPVLRGAGAAMPQSTYPLYYHKRRLSLYTAEILRPEWKQSRKYLTILRAITIKKCTRLLTIKHLMKWSSHDRINSNPRVREVRVRSNGKASTK